MMKKSFCFILNPLEVVGNAPIEIIPNHWLQKADSEQIDLIREKIFRHYAHNFPLPAYEYTWLAEEKDGKGGSSRKSQALSPDKWRYWVVAYDGPNTQIRSLQFAVNLLQVDLDLGFNFVYRQEGQGPGIISGGMTDFSFLQSHLSFTGDGSLKVTTNEIKSVNGYFQSIKACEKEHPHIHKAVNEFFQLKSLPRNSGMVVLGSFAVIESLVAHDPKEDFDSLNHQISAKMLLLSKRFERQLDYDGHFGQLAWEAVWKKLYAYRSALAHGTPADFKTKFQILKDPSNALNFLKEAAKLTLLFAMKEPEFLADLKKC